LHRGCWGRGGRGRETQRCGGGRRGLIGGEKGTDKGKRERTWGRSEGKRKGKIYWWPLTLNVTSTLHAPSHPPTLPHRQEIRLLCRRYGTENGLGMVEHSRTWADSSQGCRQREVGETAAGHETSLVGEDFSGYQLVHRPVV